MSVSVLLLIIVIVMAIAFDFINGFHDAANAIATSVSTGVLPLRTAVGMAAVLNFLGALTGTAVASTIGKGIVSPDVVTQVVVLSGLIGAIFWNLFTWYFGIPSSSSHALVGGIVGAALARGGTSAVQVEGLLKTVKSLIISPLVGMFIAFTLMIVIYWICRKGRPARLNRRFRWLQMISAGFMAMSHGSNDAQKTMGIVTMALVAHGVIAPSSGQLAIPTWVVLICALAMGLGTAAGGVRIIKTMGTKIVHLRPIHGFAAETSAAVTILTASHFGLPVSTTHVISGAILGVGASKSVSAVRWGITTKIFWAWVLTIPITAFIADVSYRVLTYIGF